MDSHEEKQDYLDGIIPHNTIFTVLQYIAFKKIIDHLDFTSLADFFEKHNVIKYDPVFRPFEMDFNLLAKSDIELDLYACYKQNIVPVTGWRQLETRIHNLYDKFSKMIKTNIQNFENDYSKFKKMSEIEHQKKMIVPKVNDSITIPLNIRFAVIKRANGKCEECTRPIKKHPIDAYQIRDKNEKK